jgi:hypothetical protein
VEALDAGDVVTDSFNYQVSAGGRTGSSDIDQAVITVTIIGVNDAPTLASMSNVSLAENVSSGTSVATASGSDADASASLTYSISSGNSAGKFAINSSTGAITTAASLDYETTTSYTLVVQVSDGTLTATTNQVVNITDVNETSQYTGSTNSGTAATWGANFSKDMVLNNAWSESKVLVVGGVRDSTFEDYGENLGYTITYQNKADKTSNDNYNLIYWSQFEAVWNMDYSSDRVDNQIYEDYLMAGGSIIHTGEWWSYTAVHNEIENFIVAIDSDASSSTKTSIISGDTKYGDGSFTSTNELHDIPAAYNVSTWGSGGSGTETSGQADTVTREDGVMAGGTFDIDYAGSGDLITISDYGNNTDKGFIMEWDGSDTDAEYFGTYVAWLDSNKTYSGDGRLIYDVLEWMNQQAEAVTGGITTDTEYLPIGGLKTTYGWTNTSNNQKSSVEAFHMGNNVYIGGGFDHLDWVWDDSANAAFVALNSDMDGADEDEAPTRQDDHYLVVGADTDGDANLWETTDVFDLDKVSLLHDSADFLTQDTDASGDYYFKITPVTYANSTWTVETDNTVTIADTDGYLDYVDLTSNSDFDDINYAIIESESALISEVIVTY